MATFVPRTSAPTKGNKYYTRTDSGGYSNCILGNTKYIKRLWPGATIPNCVGYALGRFNEIGGYNKFKYSWGGNAGTFITGARSAGLQTGTIPKEGAIIVWSNNSAGHVAIVEKVKSNTEIVISQSGWSYKGSTGWWQETHKKGNGNWTTGTWMEGNYKFAGFVYSPVFGTPTQTTVSTGTNPIEDEKGISSVDAYNKQMLAQQATVVARNYNQYRGMDLLTGGNVVESPFIIAKIGNYTFGSYTKEGTINKLNSTAKVTFPNYMDSIKVTKTNGTLNQYELSMIYQITPGSDPNLLDRVLSTVSDSRAITLSYGDWETPSFIYQNEEAIITKVTSNIDFANQQIKYTLSCTSKALKAAAGSFDFVEYNKKASDVIRDVLLKNAQYGLLEIFPGMKNAQTVADAGLIPGDDKVVKIESQKNMDPLKYLNYVVGCMTSNTSTDGVIKNATYHLVIMDDTENQFGGPYFKIVKIGTSTRNLTASDVYEVDIGYPTSTFVTNFQINTDNSWSILYDYGDQITTNNYVYTIDNEGNIRSTYTNSSTISPYYNRTMEIDKTWWTRMTQFPITATLTIKGLLRPAILMNYLRVNTYFYGQKHISSGMYVITKQEDTINSSGYRTVLTLTRVSGDDDTETATTTTTSSTTTTSTSSSTKGKLKNSADVKAATYDESGFN